VGTERAVLYRQNGTRFEMDPPADGVAYTPLEIMDRVSAGAGICAIRVVPFVDGIVFLMDKYSQDPIQRGLMMKNEVVTAMRGECTYGDVVAVSSDRFYWMGNPGPMFPRDGFYQVSCPAFTVGVEIKDGLVIQAPPMFGDCIGKLASVLCRAILDEGAPGKGPVGLTVSLGWMTRVRDFTTEQV